MASNLQELGRLNEEHVAFSALFSTLTHKQHEVFGLVAEGRTTKEIAWRLGITDSAVNQRIEAVRSRAGSPPRAELARAYRHYVAQRAKLGSALEEGDDSSAPSGSRSFPEWSSCGYEDARSCRHASVWKERPAGLIVPDMFAGPNAGLNRIAAMVVIAAGLLTVAMMSLSVAQALASMS